MGGKTMPNELKDGGNPRTVEVSFDFEAAEPACLGAMIER